VKHSENDKFVVREFISEEILAEAKFPNFTRIKLAEPRASAGKAQ
jgi:hypothetical protein